MFGIWCSYTNSFVLILLFKPAVPSPPVKDLLIETLSQKLPPRLSVDGWEGFRQ